MKYYAGRLRELFGGYVSVNVYGVFDGTAAETLFSSDLFVISTDAYGSSDEADRHIPRYEKNIFDKFRKSPDVHRNSPFSSVAVEAAYRHGEEWPKQLMEYLSVNFDSIHDYREKYIPGIRPNIPDAAYLVRLGRREPGPDNDQLRDFIINKASLGLNEGYTFGRNLSGYMRLNAVCPRAVLKKALSRLKKAVDSL